MLLFELFNINEDASAGATASGSIAAVSAPLGQPQRRDSGSLFSGTYVSDTDLTPNTPAEYKKYKRKK